MCIVSALLQSWWATRAALTIRLQGFLGGYKALGGAKASWFVGVEREALRRCKGFGLGFFRQW